MSPYQLLQEIYHPDEWKILMSCIFLNLTSRKQVDQIRGPFFERWPSPYHVKEEHYDEIVKMIAPLGLKEKRAKTIIRFSHEFIHKNWNEPKELYGIGQYGQDSFDIFVRNKIIQNPSDHVLKKYILWKLNPTSDTRMESS